MLTRRKNKYYWNSCSIIFVLKLLKLIFSFKILKLKYLTRYFVRNKCVKYNIDKKKIKTLRNLHILLITYLVSYDTLLIITIIMTFQTVFQPSKRKNSVTNANQTRNVVSTGQRVQWTGATRSRLASVEPSSRSPTT